MNTGTLGSEVVRISSKGQVVIPKKIRDALRLQTGAELVIRGSGDSIIMVPVQSYTEVLQRLGRALASDREP